MTLGERIKALREKEALSQEALGGELGVSAETVADWEAGRAVPGLDELAAISKRLKVSLDELVLNEKKTVSVDPAAELKKWKNIQPKRILLGLAVTAVVVLALWLFRGQA